MVQAVTAQAVVADRAGEFKEQVRGLLSGFSLETTPPQAIKLDSFRNHLRTETSVYVTFLPGSDFNESVATAKRLRAEGFNPVPHLAARSLPSKSFLDDAVARLVGEAGVREVLCIGGAVSKPVGEFADTMQMLDTGVLDKHGIRRIGVAGHPEGTPDISDAGIAQALAWKNAFAARTGADLYIMTQFCFEAGPIIAWDKRIRAEGNRLPIRVGIPGLATIKTLAGYAKSCGIGASATFLLKQARNVAKLMTVSTPDKLIADLAAYRANDPACGVVGCHMYPLGGLKKTAAWTYAVADGQFVADDRGGFRVTVDLA